MNAPKRPDRAVVVTAAIAAPVAGFIIGWAWWEHRVWFWTGLVLAALLALCVWIGHLFTRARGTHAADPLTAPVRALPPEMLAAPIAEPPACPECGQTTGIVLCDGCKFHICRACGFPCACGDEAPEDGPREASAPLPGGAPRTAGLPEGDTHPPAWPPQEAGGPGDLPGDAELPGVGPDGRCPRCRRLLGDYHGPECVPLMSPATQALAAETALTPLGKALAAVEERAGEIAAIQTEPTDAYLKRLERPWAEDTGTFTREALGLDAHEKAQAIPVGALLADVEKYAERAEAAS